MLAMVTYRCMLPPKTGGREKENTNTTLSGLRVVRFICFFFLVLFYVLCFVFCATLAILDEKRMTGESVNFRLNQMGFVAFIFILHA